MKTDIEIAQEAELRPITEIAEKVGLSAEDIIPYGRYKAKVPLEISQRKAPPKGKLILVAGINPTPAGEGKSTMSVGLADAVKLTPPTHFVPEEVTRLVFLVEVTYLVIVDVPDIDVVVVNLDIVRGARSGSARLRRGRLGRRGFLFRWRLLRAAVTGGQDQ